VWAPSVQPLRLRSRQGCSLGAGEVLFEDGKPCRGLFEPGRPVERVVGHRSAAARPPSCGSAWTRVRQGASTTALGVNQAYLVKLDESGVAADIEKDKKNLLYLHRSQFLNTMPNARYALSDDADLPAAATVLRSETPQPITPAANTRRYRSVRVRTISALAGYGHGRSEPPATDPGGPHQHESMPSHGADMHAQHMRAMRGMAGTGPTVPGQDAVAARFCPR
jgi:hypothetical protein